MIQHINLYQDHLKKNNRQYHLLLYPTLAMAVVLILVTAFQLWNIQNLKTRLKQSQEDLNNETEKVSALLAKMPSQNVNQRIHSEINEWEKKLNGLLKIKTLLKQQQSTETSGFSEYFQALARQPVSELWLTHIAIEKQSADLILGGAALKSSSIPVLLQNLQRENVFRQHAFENLTINQSPENEELINFIVSSNIDQAKSKP